MSDALVQWRQVAPQSAHNLVFPRQDGQPWRLTVDLERWHKIQELAQIAHPSGRPYYLHEARHTAATLLLMAGIDPSIRKAIMGHTDIKTTATYEHATVEMARQALEQVVPLIRPAAQIEG
ncbi:MAG: tyrosine-type recombinase/integrase [Micrococcales bacterium]|nr:tyrosine-type recombinase/integrase [Micrococcales bacterium]